MIEELIKIDHQIFQAINTGLSNVFFDWLMPILREKKTWIPVYAFIFIFFTWKYRLNGLYFILFFVAAVGIADFGSASIIKPLVNRDRPCQEVGFKDQVISRVACGSGKSFPSSHATDHFAMAIFMITIFHRKWKWIVPGAILWAGAISFAQIYVGVHFPLDIITGTLIGSLVGFLIAKLLIRILPFFNFNK
ncbi:MAG: phosphatase PAP2 family protein [Pelobium sp.]